MSRPTDTERGACIAAAQANTILNAHFQPALFPARLTPDEFELWCGILESADNTLRECYILRGAGHVQ